MTSNKVASYVVLAKSTHTDIPVFLRLNFFYSTFGFTAEVKVQILPIYPCPLTYIASFNINVIHWRTIFLIYFLFTISVLNSTSVLRESSFYFIASKLLYFLAL